MIKEALNTPSLCGTLNLHLVWTRNGTTINGVKRGDLDYENKTLDLLFILLCIMLLFRFKNSLAFFLRISLFIIFLVCFLLNRYCSK